MSKSTKSAAGATPLSEFRTLIVCRGPIAMEALEVAAQLGMPRPHIIVSKREVYESAAALAPWSCHYDLFEKMHVVDDYRDQEAILNIPRKHNLQGIYVGYGLNAENSVFVRACEDAGLTPCTAPSTVMEFSASKFRAKKFVRDELGIRVLPGSDKAAALAIEDGVSDAKLIESVQEEVAKILEKSPGQVIRLKAVQSGGGKGQRLITTVEDAAVGVRQIWAEISAKGVGGDKGILVEANLAHPRHWEVQTFSDGETFVHFGARECSIQNAGSQKFVEVSLHPNQFDHYIKTLDPKKDKKLIGLLKEESKRIEETCNSAVQIMKALKYRGAATVEFLVSEDGGPEVIGKPHFMEINSRIQVEHRVSEAVSRVHGKPVRLVGEQFRVGAGEKLGYTQKDISFDGYSTELRINTSNSNFLIGASGSVIEHYNLPARDESFYYDDGGAVELFERGSRKSWAVPNFDSNFGLAVFHAEGQRESFGLSLDLLESFDIRGNEQLKTTRPFHLGVLSLLKASAPYGKVRTDFSEIFLAFGALIYQGLAKIKPREIGKGDPAARMLLAGLKALQSEPGMAIALGFKHKELAASKDIRKDEVASALLQYLQRLLNYTLFAEEAEAVQNYRGDLPGVLKSIVRAVEDSRIFEFKRNDDDLEYFIPPNVRNSRERKIVIEELRDATVQAVTPRALEGRELDDLREIVTAISDKVGEEVKDKKVLETLRASIEGCQGELGTNSHLTPAGFSSFYDTLRGVKWAIKKSFLDPNVENVLMAEVNRAVRVVRGPNVIAHLAGTIFLKPSPDKPEYVTVGDEVFEDETVLALLENMKMFNEIRAHMSGRIKRINVENERPVLPGDILMVIE